MSKLQHTTLGSSIVSSLAIAVLAVLGSPSAGRAQPLPQSGEILVNQYFTSSQNSPVVAADSEGTFVVVWSRYDAEPSVMPDDIAGIRLDSSGNALGEEFLVNTVTANRQRSPWVARAATGGFVVVWVSALQDGDNYGVFGRRYDASGNAVAAEFQVNSYITGSQTFPKIAMGAGGDFVVVWQSFAQDGSDSGVFARRFDSAAVALGVEFQVNLHTTGDQQIPSVSLADNGSFVVAWNSENQDGSPGGSFARRFTSGGVALGGEFQLHTYTTNIQTSPFVAHAPGGAFVAVWTSEQDGASFGIFGRGFDAGGNPTTGEFQINAYTSAAQTQPAIHSLGSNFVVVWSGNTQDGDSYGVFGRAIASDGKPRGDEFQINTTFTSSQRTPRVAGAGQRFAVVWQGPGDGSGNAIFARRYLLALTLDVDGDGEVKALTDTMLIMRHTFGFRGDVLIDGAVGDKCSRCTAPLIEAYIEQM